MKNVFLTMAVLVVCCGFASASIILNPGAEAEEDFADWYHSASAFEVADNGPSAPGTQAFAIPTGGDIRPVYVAVTPGQVLDLTFDYKSTEGTTGWIWGLLRYWDETGGWLGQDGGSIDITNGAWQIKQILGSVVPAGAATADIGLFPGTFLGEFRFDNFNLTVVPEPATLSIMGIGALVALRRKKA